MRMSAPLFISLVHYFICSVGVAVNSILLMLIICKTPSNIKSYSILLFSQAFLQCVTCASSGVLFVRLIPHDMSVFYVVYGIGSSQTAFFILYSIMLHGIVHYSVMLAVCFYYRLHVILYPIPSVRSTAIIAIATYLPTAIIFAWHATSTLFDPQSARTILANLGPDYVFNDQQLVTGIVNVLEPSVVVAITWGCGIAAPVYVIVIEVSRRISRKLSSNSAHLSEKTRASHKEIMKGLVLQACLPAVYLLSSGTYIAGQMNPAHSLNFEFSTHMSGELIAATSPFLTLYFVKPYQRAMYLAVCKKSAAPTSVIQVHQFAKLSDSRSTNNNHL